MARAPVFTGAFLYPLIDLYKCPQKYPQKKINKNLEISIFCFYLSTLNRKTMNYEQLNEALEIASKIEALKKELQAIKSVIQDQTFNADVSVTFKTGNSVKDNSYLILKDLKFFPFKLSHEVALLLMDSTTFYELEIEALTRQLEAL